MITIIGSGKVGGDAALFSALKKLDDQILLLDIAKGLPQGEAMDINHMLSEQGIDVEVKGSNDYADMKGSNVVVVVAGSGRKPGMTRMDLLKINASLISLLEFFLTILSNSIVGILKDLLLISIELLIVFWVFFISKKSISKPNSLINDSSQ